MNHTPRPFFDRVQILNRLRAVEAGDFTLVERRLIDALADISGYGISPNNGYPVVSAAVVKKARIAIDSLEDTGEPA